MKLSNSYFKTYRENPQDAEITSHKLLARGGFIKKQSAGSYMFLPLGLRVLNKIKSVVIEEMNNAGAQELLMPMLMNEEVYENRLKVFGQSMFRLKDRNGRGMCLGPTHEELFTELVRDTVSSYKNLPLNLYQVSTKFRDEMRPRFGLQRAVEFLMKDAYSYDRDLKGLENSFEIMKTAYRKIFDRLNLDYVVVEADNGPMGGFGSNEFMVKSDIGEDEIAVCENGDYAANIEKAEVVFVKEEIKEEYKEKELVYTPNLKTIDDVSNFLKIAQSKLIKAVVYEHDNGIAIVYLRGDREVEEVKLVNRLKTINLELLDNEKFELINSVPGFVGAVEKSKNVTLLADNEIQNIANFVMGANKKDYHYINCNLDDLKNVEFMDLRKVVDGDKCPQCGGKINIIRGIEIGHVFKLGTHYTELLNCKFLDENGKEQFMYMGCYGIGVSRAMSAVVEQHNDEEGIVWPEIIAPYKIAIIPANVKDENQLSNATEIYEELKKKHQDVLLDDRRDSYGVKVKDAKLIGVPYIIVAGRALEDGKFEVINRKTNESQLLTKQEILQKF